METNSLKKSIGSIVKEVDQNPWMSEDELYNVMIKSDFFKALGYEKIGVDIKPQYIIPGERKKPDYVCRDMYQNVIFVMEAKKPRDEKLEAALDQLWQLYVLPLKARYGVLTNGRRLILYRRSGDISEPLLDVDLKAFTERNCKKLYQALQKPDYDIMLHSRVLEYFINTEKLSLQIELAKDNFFETFQLTPESVFGNLVLELMKLFDWVLPKSKFLRGAYSFWQRSLARKPGATPKSWRPFLGKDGDLFKFMFCLESTHALIARLILAKACEDLGFPGVSISDFISQKIHQFRGQIPIVGYPLVLMRLLKEMRDQLVYSIFEEDIFTWWFDCFTSLAQKSSGELLQQEAEEELEGFSTAIAHLLFAIYKYDFSEVAGDPLGDLYQQYFDRETRKALGEFYTPTDVVNYILDAVEYRNVRHKRLLDPACGSGTFLVEALHRYIKEMEPVARKIGWASVLRELCNSPRIVGFDIHPFACLIAQVRFMMELMPYYKKAIEEERAVVVESLQRLPIFRTDSLAMEMKPEEIRKAPRLFVTEEDIWFRVSLPIKASGEESITLTLMIPSWKKTSVGTQYDLFNLDEYFCVTQGIFDAIKAIVRETDDNEIRARTIEPYLKKYLVNKDFGVISGFFKPYADKIIKEIRRLQAEFEDGRLIKSIEDAVLAALLKNYMQYDFVVGNPPYVRIQLLPKENVEQYKKTYESAFGKFDVYFLFLERGVRWLRRGNLGYICSNKFMQVSSAVKLRSLITRECRITQIVDFGDSGVFEDVTNYPCIIVLNCPRTQSKMIKCVRVAEPAEALLTQVARHAKEKSFCNDNFSIFEYPEEELGRDIWKLMPETEKKVFDRISTTANTKLREVAERIFTGVQSGADKIYIMKENSDTYSLVEKTLLRPFLKGEDIRRWRARWRHLHIFYPHEKVDNKVIAIRKASFSRFPESLKWIEAHKDKAARRVWYGKTAEEMYGEWYGLMYAGDPEWYEQPKIITPALMNRNSFALDEEHYYFPCGTAGGYGIAVKQEFEGRLLYLLGLLNSKTLEYYLKKISPMFSGGYYKYSANYLEQLPIKLPKNTEETKLAKDIMITTQKIITSSNPERVLEGFPEAIVHEYGQRGVEFDAVNHIFSGKYDSLKPVLTGQSGKAFAVYPNDGETPIFVETEEKARYLVLALREKSVNKNDKIRLLIPRDNSIAREILNNLKERVAALKETPVEGLEETLNEQVYELYGINNHDKIVIEEFLKKF